MPRISARKASEAKHQPSTITVFAHKKDKTWTLPGTDKATQQLVDNLKEDGLSFGDLKKGQLLRGVQLNGYKNLLVVGLDEGPALESIRRASAQTYALMRAHKIADADFHFDSLAKGVRRPEDAAQAATEGFLLAAYDFDVYKSKAKDDDAFAVKGMHLLTGKGTDRAMQNAIANGVALSECVNFTRSLGDEPGNKMTPPVLANEAAHAAKGTKLKVTVWDKARIKKEGMGGLYGVNLGGGPDCRFIIMEYNGAAKSRKPVVFVGKGLTFDSGGISIKPSQSMEEMKYDMCGGAAVIGTMLAIARLKLKVNAVGLVPSTENMPGPMANKPGDILTARNGKTVEVFNTDAEGRLILMDALSYASELKPAAIFDAATLTGAVVVALGNSYTGVFTRDKKLMKGIEDAAEISGEAVWPMPINDHHVSDMKGTFADLCNISSFRGAGSSTAAAFLEQFVEKGIPWAHFDIAGTAWAVGNRLNYCSRKGASGVMVRTFVELAKKYG